MKRMTRGRDEKGISKQKEKAKEKRKGTGMGDELKRRKEKAEEGEAIRKGWEEELGIECECD